MERGKKNRKKEKEKERSSESSEIDVQSILIKIQICLSNCLSVKITYTFTTNIVNQKGYKKTVWAGGNNLNEFLHSSNTNYFNFSFYLSASFKYNLYINIV